MPEEKEVAKEIKKPFNYWMIATIILAALLIVTLFTGGITGNAIGAQDAGQIAQEYINSYLRANEIQGEVIIENTKKVSGFYQIEFSINGEPGGQISLSQDGKYLGQMSLIEPIRQLQNQQQPQEEDWTVFHNSLTEELTNQILGFNFEEPKTTENPKVSEFENYKKCDNTLIVFYHPGCGWCERYYHILIQAQEDYPELELYALDLSQNRDIAEKYGVAGTPANIINCKYFISGYMDKEVLYNILEELNKK